MSGAPTFAEAFLAGDVESAAALLAEDVTFHSPMRDYHGRERVVTVLSMVAEVLGRGSVEAVLEGDDGDTATFFTAQVGEGTLEGVVRTHGPDITLMARPLRVLLPAVDRLQNAAP
jgi:predicted SnoaL-like aldol condensation-catalyzing enzyme